MSSEPFPQENGSPDGAPAPAGVNATTGELTGEAPGLTDVLPEVLDRLDSVEELAANLFEELTSYPAGGPWFWKELKPEQRKELWAELDTFVVWLQNRILRHWSNSEGWIPACWYRHPDAVELLTALMVAHKAAYGAKSKKPSFELTEWFSRALWPTMETFKQRSTFKYCLENQSHADSTSQGLELRAESDDFEAFVDEDTTSTDAAQTENQAEPVDA